MTRDKNDTRLSLGRVWRAITPPPGAVMVRHDAVWAVHMISAAVLAGPWGLWLILPFHTFATSVAYRTLAVVMPEAAWGLLMTAVAALLYAGSVHGVARARVYGAAAAVLALALIAAMLAWSNIMGTGWWVYAILALANFWALRQLTR